MDNACAAGIPEADEQVTAEYSFRLSPYLRGLLRDRPADDPLSRQFIPDRRELEAGLHESPDPIGDESFSPVRGIVHRYPDRVLLKVTHLCPVYCRFCFRRDMVGSNGMALHPEEIDAMLDYVARQPQIWEAILTGGDPLSLSGRRLGEILRRLSSIEHLEILRIHSRVPIVDPAAVNESRLAALRQDKPLYFVVHVNHADELTEPVVGALRAIAETGAVMLSQTVLLKGVNDDVAVLERLLRRLVRLKVRPYYLHHPDLARGTAHFRVPIEVGQELVRSLRGKVSGLCQPTYVLDIPGGHGKVPVGPAYIGDRTDGGLREVADHRGHWHCYPE